MLLRLLGRRAPVVAAFPLVAVAFLLVGSAVAQTPFSLDPRAPAPSTGIHVAGDWTITVREPDGTLVSEHRFSNDLTTVGAARLASLLARTATTGLWKIEVFDTGVGASGPCLDGSQQPFKCQLVEQSAQESTAAFATLQVTAPTTGEYADRLVLYGTFTAERDSEIDAVEAQMSACASSTAPDSCTDPTEQTFSWTPLASTIPVSNGKIVAIEVVYSFN